MKIRKQYNNQSSIKREKSTQRRSLRSLATNTATLLHPSSKRSTIASPIIHQTTFTATLFMSIQSPSINSPRRVASSTIDDRQHASPSARYHSIPSLPSPPTRHASSVYTATPKVEGVGMEEVPRHLTPHQRHLLHRRKRSLRRWGVSSSSMKEVSWRMELSFLCGNEVDESVSLRSSMDIPHHHPHNVLLYDTEGGVRVWVVELVSWTASWLLSSGRKAVFLNTYQYTNAFYRTERQMVWLHSSRDCGSFHGVIVIVAVFAAPSDSEGGALILETISLNSSRDCHLDGGFVSRLRFQRYNRLISLN